MSDIKIALLKLNHAIEKGRRKATCLTLWSKFIRDRDGHQCVLCNTKNGLAAHHIVRKSFIATASLMTGNGITLCKKCHKEKHKGFNGKANILLPMDSQGGEKIELLVELYEILLEDALERDLLNDENYFLSHSLIATFKHFQGINLETAIPGYLLEQAVAIWYQCPRQMLNAVAEANGISMPTEFMQNKNGSYIQNLRGQVR
jgi:hypothetical protein